MGKTEKEYLTLDTIKDRFPFLSKSTILKLIDEGDFPKGKKVRSRTIWSTIEMEEWLDERD